MSEVQYSKENTVDNIKEVLGDAELVDLNTQFIKENKINWVEIWFVDKDDNNQLRFKSSALYEFLEENGYASYLISEGVYDYIRISNNIIERVSVNTIAKFMFEKYLPCLNDAFFREKIETLLLKSLKAYLVNINLNRLPNTEVKQHRGTADSGYFYFANTIIKVTKNGIEAKDYSYLDSPIWRTQITPRQFTYIDENSNCDFGRFITATCSTNDSNSIGTTDEARLKSVRTALGYLLHNYNDPSYPVAVAFTEENTSGKATGRTGKSLMWQALNHVVKVVQIDGKNLKFDNDFALQELKYNPQIIAFDDTTYNFKFDRLFNYLTAGYKWQGKFKDIVSINFADNPKTMITTNFTIPTVEESYRGRLAIIELNNFFCTKFTPADLLGRMMFGEEWDDNEWNLFYSYLIDCVVEYLKNDARIAKFESESSKEKQIIYACGGRAFYDFFVNFFDEIPPKREYEITAAEFSEMLEKSGLHNKGIAGKLDVFCEYKNFSMNNGSKRVEGKPTRLYNFFNKNELENRDVAEPNIPQKIPDPGFDDEELPF